MPLTYISTYAGNEFKNFYEKLKSRLSEIASLSVCNIGVVYGVTCVVKDLNKLTYIRCQLCDVSDISLERFYFDTFDLPSVSTKPMKGLKLAVRFKPYVKAQTIISLNKGLQQYFLDRVVDEYSRAWCCDLNIVCCKALRAVLGTCRYLYGLSDYDWSLTVQQDSKHVNFESWLQTTC